MKKINIKPVEVLILEFADGTQKQMKFTSKAMFILSDEFGGFEKAFTGIKEHPFECGAKIIYAGMKVCDPSVDYDEVSAMVTDMSVDAIIEIYDFATSSFGDLKSDTLKKT
jgi:hypothetical protein